MEITERDLENLIFDDLRDGGWHLHERGFKCPLIADSFPNKVFWYRQVPMKSYGIADIIGFTRYRGIIHVALIELKNVPITANDFEQLFRYKQGIRTIVENTFDNVRAVISSILVGPSISSGHYINNVTDCTIVEFNYSLKGFDFQSHNGNWVRTDCKNITLRDIKCTNEIVLPGLQSIQTLSN